MSDLAGPVLVIGGAGYIGSLCVRALAARDVSVVVFDDLSTGHRKAVETTFVLGDLADRTVLRRVFADVAPRAVMHFAGRAYVGESVADPALYYRKNVVDTFGLLEEMRAADCREIVFSSSCTTYGLPVELPITEAHPLDPISPYGHTKLHIEHMLHDYATAYGLRFAALRYFNAAGAARDGTLGELHEPETHLIPLVLQVASGAREELLVFGEDYDTPDGTCIRDYVHVEDLAAAHVSALMRLQDGERQLVCNLGTGTGHSVREVVEAARRITGKSIATRAVARRPGDPPRLVCDGTLARDRLGWTPERSALDDVVGDAWNFTLRNPQGFH